MSNPTNEAGATMIGPAGAERCAEGQVMRQIPSITAQTD